MEIGQASRAVTPHLEVEVWSLGPGHGHPVVLLHGWPDSVRTWREVAPFLAEAGYRVLMPSLRGFGGTRFRHPDAMRSGQLVSLGQDVMDVADAMGLQRFSVVGHDWGARAAYIAACLWPERISSCVALSVG
jgi:pimeloyl-ACP methyl ester carboxylesterase